MGRIRSRRQAKPTTKWDSGATDRFFARASHASQVLLLLLGIFVGSANGKVELV